MDSDFSHEQPIRDFFSRVLHECLNDRLGMNSGAEVELYLADMLARFIHQDGVYAIRDAMGRRVFSLTDLMAEGDIRMKANSFERERQVHRHIGDLLLFWSGVFPEFLRAKKSTVGVDGIIDPVAQGRISYYVASTFDHDPYTDEARVLRLLSEDFEGYKHGLNLVRESFGNLGGFGLAC